MLRRLFSRGDAPTTNTDLLPQGQGRWRPFAGFKRLFKAAQQDRLTADWLSGGGDLNLELRSQLPIIRLRSRELEQNSCLARRFFALCQTHIVGPEGFVLQVQAENKSGKLDSRLNRRVETEFWRWGKRGVCELSGRFGIGAVERVLVRTLARDGELLLRLHDVKPSRINPWGFVVELLDPARLDHLLNVDLPGGNKIRLGVELNPSGRPVAYHLLSGERRGMSFLGMSRGDRHERVLAEDIIHHYESDQPEQLRGVPWMASAMLTVHQIGAYQEAAVVAARSGASKMGWYKRTGGNGAGSLAALADGKDDNGDFIEEFTPGHLGVLPDDYDFVGFDPKYPHENYDPFVKANHRDIAVGLNVSYHALTGDLTDVNFSSIRSGTLEEREAWKVRQEEFAAAVMERIYLRWLGAAAFNGRFGSANQEDIIIRASDHRWQGRRWSWVDPLKDIAAVVASINAGLTSPQRVAAEMGLDMEDLLDEIAAWQKMVTDKNVTFPIVASGKTAAGGKSNADAEESDKDAKDSE